MEVYFQTMFWLSLAGVLFSGYLAGTRFFTRTCAFNEPCPVFLGYSACYFGFGMFLLMLILSIWGLTSSLSIPVWANLAISFLGIIFAGYYTVPEVRLFLSGQTNYSLGLPTCSYGLIFYISIFVLTLVFIVKQGLWVRF
jgi:hypothetical protein